MNRGAVVEAVRFTAWALEFACAIVAVHYFTSISRNPVLRLAPGIRERIAIALALKSSGWGLHQFYWWTWQRAANSNDVELRMWIEDSSAVTILAYSLVFAGETLILHPWAHRFVGAATALVLVVTVGVLLAVGLAFAMM